MTYGLSSPFVTNYRAEYIFSEIPINSRVLRTEAGVFHRISRQHADLYFHEIGFRWSQRIVSGSAVRRSRHGHESVKTFWSRVLPALQLQQAFRAAVGRQMRRTPNGGISIKPAVFGL